ncbi:MAG TPA: hypothetical protein VFN10_00970 [Thermoanaerobaculia bacterium]|nr:hypothetical protein [Thermoanaerobaculia bacterium]
MTTADPNAMAVPATAARPLSNIISRVWGWFRELYRMLLPIRFSFITLGVLAFALLASDQGHDALAALAEDDPAHPGGRFAVRLLFVLLTGMYALQAWYWSRQLLRVRFPEQPAASDHPWLVKITPRLLGILGFAVVAWALWKVRQGYGATVEQPRTALLRMILGISLEALLFLIFVVLRRGWLESRDDYATDQHHDASSFGTSTKVVLGLTFLLAVVFLVASTFAVQSIGVLGTISIVLISLALWVALGGAIVYVGMKLRVPILTWLAIFAVIISPLADNHTLPSIPNSAPVVNARSTTDKVFDDWYKRLDAQFPNEAVHPVFIVATEGGGIRAAYWTSTVLSSLSDTVPGFTGHLFAISGVSGGSVGAANYASLLVDQAERPDFGLLRPKAREILAYDALAPTLAAFTQQDFVQRFIPAPILPDRAEALTGGWERAWKEVANSDRFAQSFVAPLTKHQHHLPSLFLNGTSVETGQRIIASNCRIDNDYAKAVDIFNANGFDLPMSNAALNSARFTYVSPAGTILRNPAVTPRQPGNSPLDCKPGQRCDHVVDGGYLENSGAATAAELVRVIQKRNDPRIRPYVLFIEYQPQYPAAPRPETRANEVLSPVRALLSTREARADLAVAQLRSMMTPANYTTFTLIHHPQEAQFPLGWLLAARTRNLIDKQMGVDAPENGANVRRIAAVLSTAAASDAIQRKAAQDERTMKE